MSGKATEWLENVAKLIGAAVAVLTALVALDGAISKLVGKNSILFNETGIGVSATSPYVSYSKPNGLFIRGGNRWFEVNGNVPYAQFEDDGVRDGYVVLYDPSRDLNLRFPVGGGKAEWSHSNPLDWIDLYYVRPHELPEH